MPEPIDPEWGLCDHDLLPAGYRDDEDYDDEWDDYDERYDDDDEPLGASMARLAADIELGRTGVVTPGRSSSAATCQSNPESRLSHMMSDRRGSPPAGGTMPATIQPVIVTTTLPLLLAFYKALLGAVEISRVPEEGPAFYVGLQIGNAELGIVTDGDADIAAPQRILLNVNVGDLSVGGVADLLEYVEPLGGQVLGPPNDMPWGQRVAHILDPDGNTVNLTEPI